MVFDVNSCELSVEILEKVMEVENHNYYKAKLKQRSENYREVSFLIKVSNKVKSREYLKKGYKTTLIGFFTNEVPEELNTKNALILNVAYINKFVEPINKVNMVIRKLNHEAITNSSKPQHIKIVPDFITNSIDSKDIDIYAWGSASTAIQKQDENKCTVVECYIFGDTINEEGKYAYKISPKRVTIV